MITPEQRRDRAQRANAARAARRAALPLQAVVLDADWSVVRLDALNWQIQHKGRCYGFYSNILHALQAVPARMLNPVAAGDLKQILEQQARINRLVESCLKLKSP